MGNRQSKIANQQLAVDNRQRKPGRILSMPVCDTPGSLRVGCCGFPLSLRRYAEEFWVVEVQQAFYQPPALRTLEKWRGAVPSDFEFALKAWQLITHEASSPTYRRLREELSQQQRRDVGAFRLNATVLYAWRRTLECARMLGSRCVLFQCPARFGPTPKNKANLRQFFREIKPDLLSPNPSITGGEGGRSRWPPCGPKPSGGGPCAPTPHAMHARGDGRRGDASGSNPALAAPSPAAAGSAQALKGGTTQPETERLAPPSQAEPLRCVWEPRGEWEAEEVRELCEELGLVHGVDPFQQSPVAGPFGYFRLHGRTGYRYRYSDQELEQLREMAGKHASCYVLFNNISMLEDARRFQRLAHSG
jgi:uncharacterized protein YecE (DUF72 family)